MTDLTIIPDILFYNLDELILNTTYITSNTFKNTLHNYIPDNVYQYIDYLVLKRRPSTNDFIILNDFVVPKINSIQEFQIDSNYPKGSDLLI